MQDVWNSVFYFGVANVFLVPLTHSWQTNLHILYERKSRYTVKSTAFKAKWTIHFRKTKNTLQTQINVRPITKQCIAWLFCKHEKSELNWTEVSGPIFNSVPCLSIYCISLFFVFFFFRYFWGDFYTFILLSMTHIIFHISGFLLDWKGTEQRFQKWDTIK